jgi:hypothetical protein
VQGELLRFVQPSFPCPLIEASGTGFGSNLAFDPKNKNQMHFSGEADDLPVMLKAGS